MRHCARREKPCRVRGKGSDTHKALDKANAEADESNDDKHQKQRLTGDTGTESRDPRNSLSDKDGHVGKDSSHSHANTPLHTNEALNEADTETDESDDNKHEQERIRSDSAGKRANPLNRLSDKSRNVTQNGSNSDSSRFLQKPSFF